MTYTFTIPGNPITKKNSQKIITIGGRHSIAPSKKYKDYEKAAMFYLLKGRPKAPVDYPVCVRCTYYMESRRHVDLTNLLEATDDILVSAGILLDDNRNILASHDGSRVYWDKKNPRVEIIIYEMPDWYKPWKPGEKEPPAPVVHDFPEESWD